MATVARPVPTVTLTEPPEPWPRRSPSSLRPPEGPQVFLHIPVVLVSWVARSLCCWLFWSMVRPSLLCRHSSAALRLRLERAAQLVQLLLHPRQPVVGAVGGRSCPITSARGGDDFNAGQRSPPLVALCAGGPFFAVHHHRRFASSWIAVLVTPVRTASSSPIWASVKLSRRLVVSLGNGLSFVGLEVFTASLWGCWPWRPASGGR